MELPGWLLMLLGTFVIAFSKYVESKNGSNMVLFVGVGGAFLVYGIGKELLHRLRKRPATEEKPRPPEQVLARTDHRHPAGHTFHGQSPHRQHAHTRPVQHHTHPYRPAQKQCPACHTTTVSDARFCHNCGHAF